MRRVRGSLLLAIVLVGMVGCSNLATPPPQQQVQEAVPLLLSGWMPAAEISLYQRIQVVQAGKKFGFESAIELASGEMQVILLSNLGQRLASIRYNGADFEYTKSSLLPKTFDPRHILEAIQTVYWPLTAYAEQAGEGWRFIEHDQQRQLYYREKLVAEIDYLTQCPLGGQVKYQNNTYGFSLMISSSVLSYRSAETAALPVVAEASSSRRTPCAF